MGPKKFTAREIIGRFDSYTEMVDLLITDGKLSASSCLVQTAWIHNLLCALLSSRAT